VEQTLVESSKPITHSAVRAPKVLEWLSKSVSLPSGPPAGFEPTRDALAELPGAARLGLEPLTVATQKAFVRLARDVGSIQVNARPKS
jgi:hypothetical protein